jgi:O-antigen ligase
MDRSKIVNIIIKFIKYGVCASLISPLLFDQHFFFYFVTVKTIFFRTIVGLVVVLYLILIYFDKSYLPKLNKLNISVFLFIFFLFLASIFGVNFDRSFWSVFERMVGLSTLIHLFAFYIILISVFKTRKDWKDFFLVSIIVAIPISFMVLMGKDPDISRGGGSLGNSSFFSSYILFNMFFALILILMISKNNIIEKSLYIIALFIFLFSLFFNPTTITEGAISSLLIGVVFLITLAMWFSRNSVLKKAAPIFFILMVIFGFYVVKEYRFSDKPFNLLDIPDPSRKAVWSIALKGIQERPILGWGWENFNVVFSKYYNPKIPLTGGDIWYDRAHNIVFDTLIGGGVLTAIFYFTIFFISIFYLIKVANNSKFDKNFLIKTENLGIKEIRFISLSLVSLLIVYFLQNLWVFDMISSYIMFFLTLGFIDFFVFQNLFYKEKQEKGKRDDDSIKNGIIIVLVIIILFSIYYTNVKPLVASYYIGEGLRVSDFITAREYFKKAINLSPISIFEAPASFLDKLYDKFPEFYPGDKVNDQERLVFSSIWREAIDFMEKSVQKNSYDIRPRIILTTRYNNFYLLTSDKTYLAKSLDNINFAERISPLNQEVLIQKAFVLLLLGDNYGAENILNRTIELEPRYIRPRVILINFYRSIGEEDKAEKEYLRLNETTKNTQ